MNPEERQMTEEDSLLAALKYRDRASERRMKYGKPELSSSAKKPKKRENKKRDIEEVDYYSAQVAATTNSTSILGNLRVYPTNFRQTMILSSDK